jgi:putative membrane protein
VTVGEIVDLYNFPGINWGAEAALANGIILGVLMGLRNRAAYERWWEGRRLWGQLINESRNLAWKVKSYLPPEAIAAIGFSRLIDGFAQALKDHLRSGSRLQQIGGFEDETARPAHVPLYLAGRVIGTIAQWQRQELIDPRTMQVLDVHSRALLDICGSCERIRNTPVSPSYRIMLRVGLALNVLITPWYAMLQFHMWCIPILLAFIFFAMGLELVDTDVEEPFGLRPDDLPLENYCRTIRESMTEIFAESKNISTDADAESVSARM